MMPNFLIYSSGISYSLAAQQLQTDTSWGQGSFRQGRQVPGELNVKLLTESLGTSLPVWDEMTSWL